MLSIKKMLLMISVTTAVGVSCKVVNANANPTAGTTAIMEQTLINNGGEATEQTALAGINKKLIDIVSNASDELDEQEEYEKTHTKEGYVNETVNIREKGNKDSDKLGVIYINSKISYIEDDTKWVKVKYKGIEGYIQKQYISDKQVKLTSTDNKKENTLVELSNSNNSEINYNPSGHLTRSNGVYYFGNHRESYYNLPMNRVVQYMRNLGYDYQYWVRSDGVKMFGNYVMIAANLNYYPKGTIMQCSLGKAIVCDTGSFTRRYPYGFDIATAW